MNTEKVPLIKVKELQVEFEGHKVFSDLSFEILEADFICVVGPNGAGKSTLIKTLLGQIKPSKGEVVFSGLKQKFIGYMPQENKIDRNFPASVEEIVRSGTLNQMGIRSFYGLSEKKIAERSMRQLGVLGLAKMHFADLSGGQRQRVLLARSLAATKKLLVLDEPSNNLDFKSKNELYEKLKKLNSEGVAILMVTHDLDHKNLIGKKILALNGEQYFFGDTESYVEKIHHV